MSSTRLPFHALFDDTLRNVNRVTGRPAGTVTVPVYVSHWPVWSESSLSAGFGLDTLVAIVSEDSPTLSPYPLAVTRVMVTGVSWPGAPMSTCMLSRWLAFRLVCLRLTMYCTSLSDSVSMSW